MTTVHDLTALEQAAAVRAGQVSPTELVDAYLDRIAALDGTVHAYVTTSAELARERARQAERRLHAGHEVSALHGIPIAIKDVTRVRGVRCTHGSVAFADHVPDIDDHVVTRLDRAGLVPLGKTNTPEFALTCYTENRVASPTANPWDLTRSPGGSSGGAAAAVAAGLTSLAHGTDHGGSIRIPAAACGIVGLKPSRGRISNGPAGDFSGMSTHGPLARTVADAAALLDAMAGPMPGDTVVTPPLPDGETFLGHTRREPRRLRVAAVPTPLLPGVTLHADCLAGYRSAIDLLCELGHDVDERELPAEPGLGDAFVNVMVMIAALPLMTDEERLMPFTRTLRTIGASVSGRQVAEGLSLFHEFGQRLVRELLDHYDLLLSPTLARPPVRIGELRDDADQDAEFAAQAAFMPYTPLANVTGLPSMSLPLHWNEDGLPIGVLCTGRYGAEATLISLAAQLESARPWRDRRPPLW